MADVLEQVKEISEEGFNVFKRVLDNFSPKLILNMVRDEDDLKEGKAIQAAALELLSVHIEYLGYISFDNEVNAAVKNVKPFLLNNPRILFFR